MLKHGVDGNTLQGSGPNGRIVVDDVIGEVTRSKDDTGTCTSGDEGSHAEFEPSPMRLLIAERVTKSFATVPHFYLRSEADVSSLIAFHQRYLKSNVPSADSKPSLTDLLLLAMALAMRDYPHMNRIWLDGQIIQLKDVNVGLVVQVDDGLQIPVLRQADRCNLVEAARRRSEMVDRIRSGQVATDACSGAAISLSNLGKTRVDEFTPIIALPQSSMLAVGSVANRPAAYEGVLRIRQTVRLTLAADHRVLDGVPAATFLTRLVEYLEQPSTLYA